MTDAKPAQRLTAYASIGNAGTGTLTTGYVGAAIVDDASMEVIYACHHAPYSGHEIFHALMADLQAEGWQIQWHRPVTVEMREPRHVR